LDYARAIKQAVQTLQINGCSDTDISFENPVVPGYEHTPPARDECKVFHPNGGGMNYLETQEEWRIYGTNYWFNGGTSVEGLGSPAPELIMWLAAIQGNICHAIENKINDRDASTDTVSSHIVSDGFIGEYTTALADNIGDHAGGLYTNKLSGCMVDTGQHPTAFYQVLIAR